MMTSPTNDTIIGSRYVLDTPIGKGAMGEVFRAKDRLTGKMVALKQLPPTSPLIGEDALEEYRTAIIREFQFLATLRHPNIINVYDFGFDPARGPFFVMELLENAHPVTYLPNKQTPLIADRLVQILRTLQYLHRRGIAHCDLKPANLLLVNELVIFLDLGMARLFHETTDPGGSIAYSPYEIVIRLISDPNDAPPIDFPKVDLYSAGAVGYEIATGHPPFSDEDLETLAVMILETQPDMKGTEPFTTVFGRLLQKDPKERYPDAKSAIIDITTAAGIPSLEAETETLRESFLQAATFVGRKPELTRLAEAVRLASAGQGSAWLIGGESGIGKSRFASEIAIHALVKGFLVLRGQAVSESGNTYQLWRPLLRHLCLTAQVTELDAQVLKTIIPDVDELLGRTVDLPPSVDPKTAQERLMAAIERLFQQYTRPLMLVLEDLQWADEESLTVLSTLQRLIPNHALLILATFRNDETSDLPKRLPQMQYMQLG